MLYDSVKLSMSKLWKLRNGILWTVGINGFISEVGEKVFNFTKFIGDIVSFKDLVAQEESRATDQYIGHLMIDSLVKGMVEAGGTERDVESFYAAVVADNIAANLSGAKIMED